MKQKDLASMLMSFLPLDTVPESHHIKEEEVVWGSVSGLGARIGPVASFKYRMRNSIMTKHIRSKDTLCIASRTQGQKTKQNTSGLRSQCPLPRHTPNDLTSSPTTDNQLRELRKLQMTKSGC